MISAGVCRERGEAVTADELYDGVVLHTDEHGQPDMHAWIEDRNGESAVYIRHDPTKACYVVPVAAVLEMEWPELERILTGRQPIKAIYHMARVVGYYALVENFNRSKVGENLDRRNGNYAID